MQSSGSHLPDPSRFEVFTQLANGKGFRIKTSKYIYFFDKFGGWYDEYNNYYNADGEPEEPPSDEDEDFQRFVLEEDFHGDDDDDYYDREYGTHDYDDEDYEHTHNNQQQKTLEAIAKNITLLHDYPVKTPLRVDFSNMTFKTSKPQILKHYRAKLGQGLLNVILTQEQGKFTGEGYFVCQDVSVAEKLIKYEAEEFLGRKVYFDVEPFEDNLAEPVSKAEMDIPINEDDFVSLVKDKPAQQKQESKNPKKKYFVKGQTTTQQPKKEQAKQQQNGSETQKSQTSGEKKPQDAKKQEKKQPTWAKYHGQVTMFPKKTSFKDWMSGLGFKENEHFKNPQKAESKDPTKRFATVQLRSDVYEKIQGLSYSNSKVWFEKMN